MDYFYSKKDIEAGWSTGPCYQPWSSPIDRNAHGGVPLIEYYLQQFKAAETTNGMRLLDYVDLHTYFAADYNGASVAFTTAGDTGEQRERGSTPPAASSGIPPIPIPTTFNLTTPRTRTPPSSCSPPAQAPQVIRMMKTWVANDYPAPRRPSPNTTGAARNTSTARSRRPTFSASSGAKASTSVRYGGRPIPLHKLRA